MVLDQPATIKIKLNAEDLGGVDAALAAYEQGGISIHTRSGAEDEWSKPDFTLDTDDQGVITLTITGVTSFSNFAAATNAGAFRQAPRTVVQTPAPTSAPQPTPLPKAQQASTSKAQPTPVPTTQPADDCTAAAVSGGPEGLQSARLVSPQDEDPSMATQSEGRPASLAPILEESRNLRVWPIVMMVLGAAMVVASMEVTGGTVTAERRVDRRHDLWEIEVEPDLYGDVGIILPTNRACDTPALSATGPAAESGCPTGWI